MRYVEGGIDGEASLPLQLICVDGEREAADIQIGRDLRTPPNPTLLSLRTNLLDIIFAFDLAYLKIHSNDGEKEDVDELLRFCSSVDAFADICAI